MTFLSMILVGAVLGVLAARLTRTRQSIVVSIVVGIIGSLLSALLLAPLFGTGTITAGDFSLSSFLISLAGAVLLLGLVRLSTSALSRLGSQQKKRVPAAPGLKENKIRQPDSESRTGPIFLSYRRDDAPDAVGRIYDRLVQHYGQANVFKDVDSIPFGVDFRKHLSTTLNRCSLLLVVVGRNWNSRAPDSSQFRLDDARDFVRIELEAALQRDIPIVPVLLQGAAIPSERELPASLQSLAYRQGVVVRPDPDFHHDMDRLIEGINPYLIPSASPPA